MELLQQSRIINGWFRCSITGDFTGVTQFGATPSSANKSAEGDTNTMYLGAQVEANPFPTSYIPTTSSTATCAADAATLPTAGTWR